jgi:hypothetical protein
MTVESWRLSIQLTANGEKAKYKALLVTHFSKLILKILSVDWWVYCLTVDRIMMVDNYIVSSAWGNFYRIQAAAHAKGEARE